MITFLKLGRLGRLCNQMYQIAGTIGIATKHGYEFGFPLWRNYDHAEPPEAAGFAASTEDINVQDYFVNPLPGIHPNFMPNFGLQEISWGYHDVTVRDWTSINGHLQSKKYWAHCEELVLHYFELKTPSLHLINPWLNFYRPGVTCAIHVRRGDYENNYHPWLTKEYYDAAKILFPPETVFIVFSDDIAAAKKLIGESAYYVEGNHYMTDFYLMTKCDHIICANSTFSTMAAMVIKNKDKIVVAPYNWFGAVAGINANDIYCEGWKII